MAERGGLRSSAECFPTYEPQSTDPLWGEHLRALRRAKGISQRALGEAAGVDFTYISRIERGQFPPPSGRTIERIAAALGVDAVELARDAGKVLPGYVARLEAEVKRLRSVVEQSHPKPAVPDPTMQQDGVWCDACTAYTAKVVRVDAYNDEIVHCRVCGRTWIHP